MIWDFENLLSRRLGLWAILNILAGAGMFVFGNPFWRALGLQALAWGIIDALIAWFGQKRAGQHLGRPSTIHEEVAEAVKIRRLLWINNALDVLYIAGGVAAVWFLGKDSLFWRGTGWGIALQGAFLYIFDLWHATRVPEPLQLPNAPLFTHPNHQPFLFEGGQPAALLIHGFPGTALEMRHIGQKLNDSGWTVRGVRLPGFGQDLAQVIQYRNEDWLHFLQKECQRLSEEGLAPLVVVGFSFGGGLALQLAESEKPDGLILIAPLTWREAPMVRIIADYIRAILPLSIRPLTKIDLNRPLLKEEFWQYLPEIDLDDPAHASELRHLEIPLYILDQMRQVGRQADAAAAKVTTPTLLIQGTQDRVVRPERTQHLKETLKGPVQYEKVKGPHSLTMPHNPAFETVLEKIKTFAEDIRQRSENG